VSLDYTNGQAASAVNKGFLTSADWSTFNGKLGAGANTFTGVQTYDTGASITAAANINEVLITTSVVITQGGITASSATIKGNAMVTGVITAGSAPTTITLADGSLDASKLSGAIPEVVVVYSNAVCDSLTPAALGRFCYDTGANLLSVSTSTLVGGYASLTLGAW
ncbi:MAG: hypothetical protein KKH28_10170, partial [Elusimicrobia bacterium]|nr:hypothetical protein [Elusimicrobiota bacterium]